MKHVAAPQLKLPMTPAPAGKKPRTKTPRMYPGMGAGTDPSKLCSLSSMAQG
jgi:hypothetical protein